MQSKAMIEPTGSTVHADEQAVAAPPPHVLRPVDTPPVPAIAPSGTLLYTRHMRGVIEADRDRRLHSDAHRAGAAARAARRRARPVPHPRLAAALAASRRELAEAVAVTA